MKARLVSSSVSALIFASAVGALAFGTGCATSGSREEVSRTKVPAPAAPAPAPAQPTVPQPPPAQPIAFRPLNTPPPMDFVVQKVAHQPIVSFRLVFHSGSVDDPKGKEGLTELTARVLSEGGTQSLTSAQLLEALFPMAAELNARVDKEFTVFEGRVHKDHLDRFFQIFSDVLLAPRLDPKEFERLRADQINAIRDGLRGENDEVLGKTALDAVLYPNHPYRHPELGTVQGLSAITLDDVKGQAARVFTQDRLVVGLAGPIDAALEEKVRTRLSALPKTGAPLPVLPPAPGVQQQALVLQKDALSTAVSIGQSIDVRRGDPDYFPLAFAVSYLGEHRQFTGVLMQELREKRGLNYGDYAYAEHFLQDRGTTFPEVNVGRSQQDFSIWIRPTEPANALFATRAALHFTRDLVDHGVNAERFEVIRGFLEGYTRLWEQTDQRRLGYAIDDKFYGTHEFLDSYRKALAKMTPEDVNAAVKRHLHPEALNFAYVAKDAQALADGLKSQAPSPIAYPTPKPAAVSELDKAFIASPIPVNPQSIRVESADSFMEK